MSDEITASLEVLAQSAEQGNSDSMHLLGKHYFESGDHVQAEKWYLRSIELGNVNSMVNIGVLYFTDGDIGKAKYWYQHASDFGESLATYNMGALLNSIGRKEEAIEWYFKAAELGEKDALLNLALLLNETGRKQESIEWYYKAIASGHNDAENNLRILLEELGRYQELNDLNKLEFCKVMADWFWDTGIDIRQGKANQDRIQFYEEFQPVWEEKINDFIDQPETFTNQDREDVYELLYLEAYIAGVLY